MTSVLGTRDVRAPKKRCKVRWGWEWEWGWGCGWEESELLLPKEYSASPDEEEVATGNDLWLAVLAKAASQFRSSVCLVIRWALRRMWGPTQIAPRFVECVGC